MFTTYMCYICITLVKYNEYLVSSVDRDGLVLYPPCWVRTHAFSAIYGLNMKLAYLWARSSNTKKKV